METLITQGIEVNVETVFQPEHSNAERSFYMFAYHITLSNHNMFTVQLLSRKWRITDSYADVKIVEGEGVVGRQPVLYAGDTYQYVSACDLQSTIGKMEGIYIFKNLETGKLFEVVIPVFKLIVPFALN